MALVDEALKSKKTKARLESAEFDSTPEYDELGLKVQDTTDYFVARILMLRKNLWLAEDRKTIYEGRSEIKESSSELYRLSQSRKVIKPNYQWVIWERLHHVLPVLDKSKIIITDDLVWDSEKGELIPDADARSEV